jgi:hypothetical protein
MVTAALQLLLAVLGLLNCQLDCLAGVGTTEEREGVAETYLKDSERP